MATNYHHTWIFLGFSYYVLLLVAIVIVAVKSRKIFNELNLRTPKKSTFLTFLFYVLGLCCFPRFVVLDLMGFRSVFLDFIYAATYTTITLLCQFIILFVPKIWSSIQNIFSKLWLLQEVKICCTIIIILY